MCKNSQEVKEDVFNWEKLYATILRKGCSENFREICKLIKNKFTNIALRHSFFLECVRRNFVKLKFYSPHKIQAIPPYSSSEKIFCKRTVSTDFRANRKTEGETVRLRKILPPGN